MEVGRLRTRARRGRGDVTPTCSLDSSRGHTMSLILSAGPLPQQKAAGCRASTGSACLVHANSACPGGWMPLYRFKPEATVVRSVQTEWVALGSDAAAAWCLTPDR